MHHYKSKFRGKNDACFILLIIHCEYELGKQTRMEFISSFRVNLFLLGL